MNGLKCRHLFTHALVVRSLKDRMDWKGYRSGHMMYLRQEDLQSANDDLRAFILKATPKKGVAAKY